MRRFATLLMCLLLSACARYPLGMSEAEWQQLTPEQQIQAHQQQAEINAARDAARAERERQRAEAERQRLLELEARRQNASPGDWLQCTLTGNEIYASKKWRPATDTAFELFRHDQASVEIRDDHYSQQRITVNYDGQIIELCSFTQCDRMVGTNRQFMNGVSKTVAIKNTLRGTLRCDAPRVVRKFY